MNAEPKHDLTVAFQAGDPVDVDLPADWHVDRNKYKSVVVYGPCLECHGDAMGPQLPQTLDAREAARGVVVECVCDYPHGAKGESSCGRSWRVLVPEEVSQ